MSDETPRESANRLEAMLQSSRADALNKAEKTAIWALIDSYRSATWDGPSSSTDQWRVGRRNPHTVYRQHGDEPVGYEHEDHDDSLGYFRFPEDAARAAESVTVLAELVALKDGPRGAEYERRKPLAWARARAALGLPEVES